MQKIVIFSHLGDCYWLQSGTMMGATDVFSGMTPRDNYSNDEYSLAFMTIVHICVSRENVPDFLIKTHYLE